MTWLPMTVDGRNERDVVLGVHPEVYARHREFLKACAAAIDPDLLALCKARIAQMLHCREELALHSPDLLAELKSWERSSSFTALQRTVFEFVEQFVIDPSMISRELVTSLERELGTSGVINFTTVITGYEASLRLSTLLDLEPAP
ncbi:carboxymuconolactone decarboxylase family protein [Mycobacterium arosiense]|uniref:Uncharacterized protein n=1 Tax=Mycobacterium arosiense ATCC BAA-1401 = DSM 45069 TaxID=1265311 RepID=A0A1W9ZNP1_MYCAI|nr:hypothetical protein [Mycobacterium arosiense]ORA19472.1 hypothetical protein BST14_05370 [Mycobacterium arosiense ATCC BAA-1401 = DSM 45069]